MELNKYYDAQAAVLGSLLLEPDKLGGEIMHRVREEDFEDASLRNLFRAAKSLFLSRRPLDPVTLLEEAGSGYEPMIRQILDATPTANNWEIYVEILREDAQISALRILGEKLSELSNLEAGRKLLAKAEGLLTAQNNRKAANYTEMISDYLNRQNDPAPPNYLDWGIPQLNRGLSISPGRFVVLGAESSVGKTALALQLAYNLACRGHRVGFYSYETSRADAADRILANAAEINLPRSKHKQLTERDYRAAMAEGQRAEKIDLTVVETAGYTVDDLRAETLSGRYDVVFIDYVQLIPGRASERWQVVTETSMALHTMAQQLDVTVIALAQATPPDVGKDGKRRAVRKTDLRESNQLHIDAEAVLMMDLYDPEQPSGLRVLQIEKNKDGSLGKIYLTFDPEHMRFSWAPPPDEEDEAAMRRAIARDNRAYRVTQVKFSDLPDDAGGNLPF